MSEQTDFEHRDSGAQPAQADQIAVEAMSFEQAIGELEAIVQRLERGQLDLEASIQAYERGTALRQHCDTKLEEARLRVEKLTFDREGKAKLEPFEDA